jgi:hypothetical protein
MPIRAKFEADFDSFVQEVRVAEGELGRFEKTSQNAFGGFTSSLRQADKTLGAFGVNVGPQIRAIDELGTAAGKTAKEIGLIGTAGLAAAAALAGWETGRMIADFFDLDRKIADATAKMMGWGDAAGETAAYKAGLLAQASKHAGREITDLTEAMRINAETVARMQAPSYEKFMAAAAGAHREYRGLDETTRANIRTMLDAGASVKEVAAAFQISEGAVKALTGADKLRAEQQKVNIALNKERAAAEAALAKAVDESIRSEFRQLQALQAQGKIVIDDTLPKALQLENEFGVAVDDVTQRTTESMRQWEADQEAWQKEMNDGLVIIGKVGPATEGAANQGGAALGRMTAQAHQLGNALKAAVPPGFSFEKAYQEAGFITHGSLAGSSVRSQSFGRSAAGVNVNINAQHSFFTPSSQQQLSQMVGSSVVNGLRQQGVGVG